MSDNQERRRPDVALHESVARLQEAITRIEPRVQLLGERFHTTNSTLQTLVSKTEIVEEQHEQLARKMELVNVSISTAAVAAARTEVALSAKLDGHIRQYESDRAGLKETLVAQNADRERLHQENRVRFERIERIVYLAIGGGIIIAALVSYAIQLLPGVLK